MFFNKINTISLISVTGVVLSVFIFNTSTANAQNINNSKFYNSGGVTITNHVKGTDTKEQDYCQIKFPDGFPHGSTGGGGENFDTVNTHSVIECDGDIEGDITIAIDTAESGTVIEYNPSHNTQFFPINISSLEAHGGAEFELPSNSTSEMKPIATTTGDGSCINGSYALAAMYAEVTSPDGSSSGRIDAGISNNVGLQNCAQYK